MIQFKLTSTGGSSIVIGLKTYLICKLHANLRYDGFQAGAGRLKWAKLALHRRILVAKYAARQQGGVTTLELLML